MKIVHAMVCGATVAAACQDDVSPLGTDRTAPYLQAPPVTIAALVGDPERYDGQTVRLAGEIEDRPSAHVLLVRGEGLLWAADIPVVAVTSPGEVDDIEIRGTAYARLTPERRRALEREVDAIDLEVIGDGPYVVARSIQRRR